MCSQLVPNQEKNQFLGRIGFESHKKYLEYQDISAKAFWYLHSNELQTLRRNNNKGRDCLCQSILLKIPWIKSRTVQ